MEEGPPGAERESPDVKKMEEGPPGLRESPLGEANMEGGLLIGEGVVAVPGWQRSRLGSWAGASPQSPGKQKTGLWMQVSQGWR